MSTYLFLVVGTNPVPVWVALAHLNKKLKPESIFLICTSGNKNEGGTSDYADAIKKLAAKKDEVVNYPFREPWWNTEPGDPAKIRDRVIEKLKQEFKNIDSGSLHLHYTGGTKTMGLETYRAMLEFAKQKQGQTWEVASSYLDPRAKDSPRIIDHSSTVLAHDCRKNIELRIEELASLHGFYVSRLQDLDPNQCIAEPNETPPTESADLLGKALASANKEDRRAFRDWIETTWSEKVAEKLKTNCELNIENLIIQPPTTLLQWPNISSNLNREFCNSVKPFDKDGLFQTSKSDGFTLEMLRSLHVFLTGQWLELFAFKALKEAIENSQKIKDSSGWHWHLYHSATFRPNKDHPGKRFELDVVAVLGYQILTVSCSLFGNDNRSMIKQKAFEGIYRSRQVGGEEARVIVLCQLEKSQDKKLEEDIHVSIGDPAKPIEIWGWDRWKDLQNEFSKYLKNTLKWN